MKFKIFCRFWGAVDLSVASYFGYYTGRTLIHLPYSGFFEDRPIEHKMILGSAIIFYGVMTSLATFLASDGLMDIINGTRHYVGNRTWKMLTRNEKTRKELEESLEKQLD